MGLFTMEDRVRFRHDIPRVASVPALQECRARALINKKNRKESKQVGGARALAQILSNGVLKKVFSPAWPEHIAYIK